MTQRPGGPPTCPAPRELIDAPPKRCVAGGWQPIETAPKDGRSILAYGPGWSEVEKALWLHSAQKFVIIDWLGEMLSEYEPFTHWMPLPEPPKDALK